MRQSVVERGSATVAGLDGAVDLARDRELVERCQGGDEGAFAELYSRYHRRLLRFCLRRLHEPNDAEEAVQESFAKAWRALPRFGGERRFYPWLTVIAGNVCTDVLRRRSRLVPMDDVPMPLADLSSEDLDAALLRQVDLAIATEAMTRLSERHQRVLRLREADGWSTQRIAEQEGVAVPAVDTLLWRARQAFKREFVALAESSGQLAAMAGFSLVALRRFGLRHLGRAAARVAARLPLPALPAVRSPGVLATSAALTGVALAGGGLAIANAGGTHTPSLPARTASTGSVESAAASSQTGGGVQGATATGAPRGSSANTGAPAGGTGSQAPSAAGGQPSSGSGAGAGVLGTTPTTGAPLPSGSTPSASGVVGGAIGAVDGTIGAVGTVVNPLTQSVGVGSLLPGSTSTTTTTASTTVLNQTLNGVTNEVGNTLWGIVGSGSGSSSSSGG